MTNDAKDNVRRIIDNRYSYARRVTDSSYVHYEPIAKCYDDWVTRRVIFKDSAFFHGVLDENR